MIKEYINKLSDDNQEELSGLEKQMRELLDELTYAQEWQESLQKKSSSQTSIFSPRSLDENIEENLENVQNKISRINQQIEYTRELIETHLKKKSEYTTLMLEIDSSIEKISNNSTIDSDVNTDISIDREESKQDVFDAAKVKSLLNDIYKKSEICLAFLNSNKNRCRTELNEIKKMIRNFADQVES